MEETGGVDQARDSIDINGVQVEPLDEKLFDLHGGIRLDFEPDGRSLAALAHFFFDRLEEVFDFVVIDLEVAVPRHAKDGGALQFHAGEQLGQVDADDRLQGREHVPLLRRERQEAV